MLVALIVAAATFFIGMTVRSPNAAVLEARKQNVQVFASVESRAVTSAVRIQGEVAGRQEEPVQVALPAGAQRSIVTNVVAQPGPLSNGALLGTVSDRPVFVFALDVPLFRDLAAGSKGSDVASLQKALNVATSEKMDRATMAAVRAVYAAAKVDPPGGRLEGTYVSSSEFYSLPTSRGALSLVSTASVGSELDESHPFAVLGFGAAYVSVRASVGQTLQVKVNDPVTIDGVGGRSANAVVSAIGNFQSSATTAGRPPGHDIRIDLDPIGDLAPGETVSVSFGTKVTPDTAVPTLAIRSDANGDFVMKRAKARPASRTEVIVVRNADGWTAVLSKGLSPGDEVLVSG